MNILKPIVVSAIITLLAFSGLNAQDQKPLPPKNFNVTLQEVNSGIVVKLSWTRNEDGLKPDIYNIYSTYGDQEKLTLVGRVKDEEGREEYEYYIHQIESGTYHFFVRSAIHMNNELIESEMSEIVTIEIEGKDQKALKIISEPPAYVKMGEKYE